MAIVIDDYGVSDGVSKDEKKAIEMLVRTVASHLGYLVLITAHSHTNGPDVGAQPSDFGATTWWETPRHPAAARGRGKSRL